MPLSLFFDPITFSRKMRGESRCTETCAATSNCLDEIFEFGAKIQILYVLFFYSFALHIFSVKIQMS